MKQLILTGLATEQKFGSKEGAFYLVFNDGDLRVPVSQEAAEAVVKEMYTQQEPEPEDQDEVEAPSYNHDPVYDETDDDVDQI